MQNEDGPQEPVVTNAEILQKMDDSIQAITALAGLMEQFIEAQNILVASIESLKKENSNESTINKTDDI